jgi:hypothetical protein
MPFWLWETIALWILLLIGAALLQWWPCSLGLHRAGAEPGKCETCGCLFEDEDEAEDDAKTDA